MYISSQHAVRKESTAADTMATQTEREATLLALIKLAGKLDRALDQVEALDREIDENTVRLEKAKEAGNQVFTYMLNMRLLTLTETRKMYELFVTKVSQQVQEQQQELAQLEASLLMAQVHIP